jgi:hypothetical protein
VLSRSIAIASTCWTDGFAEGESFGVAVLVDRAADAADELH